MPRPGTPLPDAATIRALIDSEGRIAARVTPGARIEALEIAETKLLVKIRARPQDGAANAAVIRLLAGALGVAPGRVVLLRGATSREKLFRIAD